MRDKGGETTGGRKQAIAVATAAVVVVCMGVGVVEERGLAVLVAVVAVLVGGVVGREGVVLLIEGGLGGARARGGEQSSALAGGDGGVAHGLEEVLEGQAVCGEDGGRDARDAAWSWSVQAYPSWGPGGLGGSADGGEGGMDTSADS